MKYHSITNYLDLDVAYLLGLVVARGSITEQGDNKTLLLEFPYRNIVIEGEGLQYDQGTQLNIATNEIRDRIVELLSEDTRVIKVNSSIQIIVRFARNSIAWRDLKLLTKNKSNFKEFEVPEQLFEAPTDIQKEFIRGIADACGYVRNSNNYMGTRRRVYLEIANHNWLVPIQLCEILQTNLGIPVQLIQWGHPNVREPRQIHEGRSWAREHQIKIFVEAFLPIGFNIRYKQELLEKFAKEDQRSFTTPPIIPCNPVMKRVRRGRTKPKHPEENSEIIPQEFRGKHFNTYWQICKALGCKQGCRTDGQESFEYLEEG